MGKIDNNLDSFGLELKSHIIISLLLIYISWTRVYNKY